VVIFYWLLPYRARLILILSASLIFYGFWKIEFIPVLLFSVIVDWWVSLKMLKCHKRHKYFLLLSSLITNLSLLFYFKYLIFFANNSIGFANFLGAEFDPIALKIILPLGISFYTFHSISYTVDVYRGVIKPEKNFILFACYVAFFPQLVAGPILRAKEVIPQFTNRPSFSFDYILLIKLCFKRIFFLTKAKLTIFLLFNLYNCFCKLDISSIGDLTNFLIFLIAILLF
jgi:D-alanyl-lipoteichoic acid acyltransferase DltB (MBOAT superfamily)